MSKWEPHTVTTDECIDPAPVAALAALFDDGLPTPSVGDHLPPLWHWVALARWARSSQISVDGHPFRGSFLPPIELPRRMFAGGSVDFHAPLRIGDTTARESRVVDVAEKDGRSGRFTIVTVVTTLHTPAGEPAVVETQNLIYREASRIADPRPPAGSASDLVPGGAPFTAHDGGFDFRTDPTLLMRFSAATANAHRIHYDWPYATGVEGYPGLVVHGPLMSLALAEAHRLSSDRAIARITHRNSAPLFCGQQAWLRPSDTANGRTVALIGPGGLDAGPHTSIDIAFP
ncbi:MaoC family dehydratase N-terminal domain-containing protein [Gordonia sp. PDNC005]|uniref:FAS1-like dehydratase domain-containing protein n=1 Tax=unclassified Gordonia (in: high G+C Gram-positive bacteria) TaxID=2657482 RepID=UPI0019662054|nr:MaoC family dehydratase N-terminal domain-containing protein [Gordonia sp. PDNC005]QRY62193.1 MaoC family dehydratase N-terminal domain-containing protein [Gordonia sp. PDNC005]